MPVKKPAIVDPDWPTISQSELDRHIRETNGTLCDVPITRAMALYILEKYNTDNRKMRLSQTGNYADTMKRDDWKNTGEPLIFAHEGILNNGQHRLEAIVRANVTVKMDLRFGIPRSAFPNTDTGAKRQAGDVLSIAKSSSPFASAAAIRMLIAYKEGLPDAYGITIDNETILEYYHKWPMVEKAVDMTHRHLNRRGFLNASSNSFTFLALQQSTDDVVIEFLRLVETGMTPARNDAPRLLRERIITDVRIQRSTRMANIERLGLFIKAWTYWSQSIRPTRLSYDVLREKFPLMEGVKL